MARSRRCLVLGSCRQRYCRRLDAMGQPQTDDRRTHRLPFAGPESSVTSFAYARAVSYQNDQTAHYPVQKSSEDFKDISRNSRDHELLQDEWSNQNPRKWPTNNGAYPEPHYARGSLWASAPV